MSETHIPLLASEFNISADQVRATAMLFADGATIPFVARYRKEATGGLDEVVITGIRDRLEQLGELDKRREAILKSLDERELLTDELRKKIDAAQSLTVLEDIYLPFRPKRRTRATVAREKGLEPLAELISAQGADTADQLEAAAAGYIDEEKGITGADEALAGARDIIAEQISEDGEARALLRTLYEKTALLSSRVVKKKEEEGAKYRDYFDWKEPMKDAPSHRVLAIRRGEKEGFLSFRIAPAEDAAIDILRRLFVKGDSAASEQVRLAAEESYKRLLGPSLETEFRAATKRSADETAIRVFADNLRELLLAPPMGHRNVLAIDPGFRTGCKVVCLDRQGKLLDNTTIYPHTGGGRVAEAEETLRALCEKHEIEAIAVGNGTAGRETEAFVRGLALPDEILVVMVNESGASVYSASAVARREFPNEDVTVRGAVSIGRRLMDPLAELVKIDPKSIGVGQYQHDVDQVALKQSLDDVVISCVSGVGVDLNTASRELLTYVAGLGPGLAGNIVKHRDENGPFRRRDDLKMVKRLGPKAFEQAAGFLRIPGSENPLDASAVHPESYGIVDTMAADQNCSVRELMDDPGRRKAIDLGRYVTETTGMPTLRDIVQELAKPGRDPRSEFEAFSFAAGVEKIGDLKAGMKLPGIVTNVAAFGAFVDIGVHQDGLVHISELADRFVRNPAEVVKVQQKVEVTVLEVDLSRNRISLSMKKEAPREDAPTKGRRRESKRPPRLESPKGGEKDAPRRRSKEKKPRDRSIGKTGGNWFADAVAKAEKEKKRKRNR